jgi:hypothetical protein
MTKTAASTRLAAAMALSCLACSSPSAPSSALSGGDVTQLAAAPTAHFSLPAWIAVPALFPEGQKGLNNCTFPLGPNATGGIWDYHPDGACWERPGPDGWVRQHQNIVHVPEHASCGGGPADVSPIRICREGGAGQPTPCDVNPTTGPLGCAICVRSVTCHQ